MQKRVVDAITSIDIGLSIKKERDVSMEGHIDDGHGELQDEEVYGAYRYGQCYRLVDQEGARCIGDGLPLTRDAELYCCCGLGYQYRLVDQEGARRIDDGHSMMRDAELYCCWNHGR